jgi:hypothetical protein
LQKNLAEGVGRLVNELWVLAGEIAEKVKLKCALKGPARKEYLQTRIKAVAEKIKYEQPKITLLQLHAEYLLSFARELAEENPGDLLAKKVTDCFDQRARDEGKVNKTQRPLFWHTVPALVICDVLKVMKDYVGEFIREQALEGKPSFSVKFEGELLTPGRSQSKFRLFLN